MKKSVEIVEVKGEGLIKLLNEVVTVMCMNYFYSGKLIGVNDTCILLENPSIVYDTGDWNNKGYSDMQKLPCKEMYIQCSSIESFFKE